MFKVKNVNGKQDQMENLQAQITELQEAFSRQVQRDTWVKWDKILINLASIDDINLSSDKRSIVLHSKEKTYHLPMYNNAHINKLSQDIGDKAVEDAAAVVFGWIQKSLLDCGCGILDVEQNLNKLELKGEKPLQPAPLDAEETALIEADKEAEDIADFVESAIEESLG